MAGLWGAKNSADRDKISDLGSTLFHSKPRKYWDFDQALLRRIVWPEAVRSVLQHDAYSCKYNKFNQFHPVMPFPARREGANFTNNLRANFFCWKVCFAAFHYIDFGFLIVWQKKSGTKAAR